MSDNAFKKIITKTTNGMLSRTANLAKRGLDIVQNPTDVQKSSDLSQFLDSVGGIPDDNQDPRFREINDVLRMHFSQMTIDRISKELETEFQKRPNGRTLKLLGFAYFHLGQLDKAIEACKRSLEITTEDPVAIYDDIGRAYILKGDLDEARKWFAKSYRYDFEFFLDVFGWEFLYVTAVGRMRMRPPIFGEQVDEFSMRALQIEMMADALSIQFGNKRGHKSLFSARIEYVVLDMAREYAQNRQKAIETIEAIRHIALDLLSELE